MKRIALIIACLGCITMVQGQSFLSLGPKVGFVSSELTMDVPSIQEAFKNNFMAGVFVRLGNKTYLQTEVNFVPKGGIFNSDNVDFLAKSIKLQTIEVPALLGGKLLDLKVANLRFMVGPVASWVIDKEVTLKPGAIGTFDESILKDLIWSIQAGLGIDVLMFTLDVRYEYGLNDIFQNSQFQGRGSIINACLGWKLL